MLGICPFALDDQHGAHLSLSTTAFTVANVLLHLVIYFILVSSAMSKFPEYSATQTVTVVFEHLVFGIVHIVMLVKAFLDRARHVALVNALDRLHAMSVSGASRQSYTGHQVRNAIIGVVYLCVPMSNIFIPDGHQRSLPVQLFYVICCFVLTNVMVFIMHIQDIATVLSDSIDGCLLADHDGSLYERSAGSMNTLSDLCDLLDDFQVCFGCHLLLNMVNDLIMITSMLFYSIADCTFAQCNILEQLYYMGVYVLPVVVKHMRLVSVIRRLEQQMANVRIVVLATARREWRSDDCIASDWSDGVSSLRN